MYCSLLNADWFMVHGSWFPEMCSGSEAGSYSRLIDFVHHSTLVLRVIKKEEKDRGANTRPGVSNTALGVSHPRQARRMLSQGVVLGAVRSFLEPFCGHLSSNVDKIFQNDFLRPPPPVD